MPHLNEEPLLDASRPIGAQLYTLVRNRIIQLAFPPGTRLSETAIANEFDVSRQPVREVFIKLAEEGLLEIRPQRGSIVPKISYRMVEDARFVREAIEADVVKLAANQFTKPQKSQLTKLVNAQKKTTTIQEFIHLDDQLHRFLAEGVGRSHAWHVVEALKVQLDRVRYLSLQQFPKAALIAQHSDIVQAINDADAAKAETAMRRHLQLITMDMPKIARQNADFFETE